MFPQKPGNNSPCRKPAIPERIEPCHDLIPPCWNKRIGPDSRFRVHAFSSPPAGAAHFLPGAQPGLRHPDCPRLEHPGPGIRLRRYRAPVRSGRCIRAKIPREDGRRQPASRAMGAGARIGRIQPPYLGKDHRSGILLWASSSEELAKRIKH